MEVNMRTKRIGAAIAFILGALLIIISLYEKHRLGNAESSIHKGESFFSGNRYAEFVGGALEGKLAKYRTPLMICLISGVVLVVAGAGILLVTRKKK